MANGQPYTIISIGQGVIQNAQLQIVRTTQVRYMVGEDGPFTYVAPPDQQSPDQVRAALSKLAAGVKAMRGE